MTDTAVEPRRLGRVEFTGLVSMTMAAAALGIDIVLPALSDVRERYGFAADSTVVASVITAYFIGFALAQVFYGPVADRFGRKPTLYVGFSIYIIGALISAFAPSFEIVLLGRLIWGVGAAGSRVIAVTVVRDRFEGDQMAKALSLILAVFILVPVFAPVLGSLLLDIGGWEWVVGACVVFVVVIGLWSLRMSETLDPADRRDLSFARMGEATRQIFAERRTVGTLVAMTGYFGVFSSYLASSELIMSDTFGRGDQFPFIFGGLAVVMGLAMLANGAMIDRFGLRRLVSVTSVGYLVAACLALGVSLTAGGRPAFWPYIITLGMVLAMNGLLFPNLNTVALIPLGAIAGTAASVIGTISTAVGAGVGIIVDRSYNGGVTPFSIALVVASLIGFGFMRWAYANDPV